MGLGAWTADGVGVVVGGTGGLGGAFVARLAESPLAQVVPLARRTTPPLDLTAEASIAAAAGHVAALEAPVRLVLDATGVLHDATITPEKTWRHLDPEALAHAFAVNATGPMLLMKHFLPLFPREGKAVFATLSAKVGSIADNGSGGWYAYRMSKAALNQGVRTAAHELHRRRPDAVCAALHPGTVDTGVSAPFAKRGLTVQDPATAADRLLAVVDGLTAADSGGFFGYTGDTLPW